MAQPFFMAFETKYGKKEHYIDIASQFYNVRKYMFDEEAKLYYHGYDETRSMIWADPETGLSGEFWLRSMGWLCAALADMCGLIPDNNEITAMLSDLLEALASCCTTDGSLLQLPARPELPGNYPETSGTLLFAYSALKSHRLGKTSLNIKKAGEKSLSAVIEKYIILEKDKAPLLKNICLMAGLGNNRNGSAEYYLSEPITENDAKGIAPLIMAYTELMKGDGVNE